MRREASDHQRGPRSLKRVGAHGETLDAITPEVDQHLTAQPVRLDDPPDFERGTLVGHG